MKINIGALYQVKKHGRMLCPSRETAAKIAQMYGGTDGSNFHWNHSYNHSLHWSKHFNCNVSYVASDSIVVLLEQHDGFCKVLTADGQLGWLVYPQNKVWTYGCIEEVMAEDNTM